MGLNFIISMRPGVFFLFFGGDIARHARLAAVFVPGTFEDDLNTVSFFCYWFMGLSG